MNKSKTKGQLRRMLTLVPYLVNNPGTSPDDVCRLFGIDRKTLDGDLELLWMCGLPPYDPFGLIDVDLDDDRITVSSADYFARPVRLTGAEAQAIASALSVLGNADDDPLGRLLAKVKRVLETSESAGVIAFASDRSTGGPIFAALRTAVEESTSVRIEYYSASRETATRRTIDPYRLINVGGQWYVLANCHSAREQRLFRLDRIMSAEATGEPFAPVEAPHTEAYRHGTLYVPSPTDRVARVKFSPSVSRWALETWPDYKASTASSGSVTIAIPYAREQWMIKQILPYLGEATVLEPPSLVEAFVTAARTLLERYASS